MSSSSDETSILLEETDNHQIIADASRGHTSFTGIHQQLQALTPFPFQQDWRWNRADYDTFVNDGYCDALLKQLGKFYQQRTVLGKERAVVPANDLVTSLTVAGHQQLQMKVEGVLALLTSIKSSLQQHRNIYELSANCAFNRKYSAKMLRNWALEFINNSNFTSVKFKRHTPYSLIQDREVQHEMSQWAYQAAYARPPMRCKDFIAFVKVQYNTEISTTQGGIWLRSMGYNFIATSDMQIYHDRQQDDDVKTHLRKYIENKKSVEPYITKFTGDKLQVSIPGPGVDVTHAEIVENYHDESCAGTNISCARGWRLPHKINGSKKKGDGPQRMVAAYINNYGEFEYSTADYMIPGVNKDGYRSAKHTIDQARRHLAYHDSIRPGVWVRDVYDNSTGHTASAVDYLHSDSINRNPGGKHILIMRDGSFVNSDGMLVRQCMRFQTGDILHLPIKQGQTIGVDSDNTLVKTTRFYDVGYLIEDEDVLVGVNKGVIQLCRERNLSYHQTASGAPCPCAKEKEAKRLRMLQATLLQPMKMIDKMMKGL